MKTKTELLAAIYSHLINLPVFQLDNPERIKVFVKGLEGKERNKSNYARDKFVEIGCLTFFIFDDGVCSVINVNIQAEDHDWIEEVREYLRSILEYLVIGDVVFYRLQGFVFRVSRTLTMANDRYQIKSASYLYNHPGPE